MGTRHLQGDTNGYTFHNDADVVSDPLVDTSISESSWATVAIIWDFKSMATSFGKNFQRKYVTKQLLVAKNNTNISVQMNTINDLGRRTDGVKPIRFRKNWVWGDPTLTWGIVTGKRWYCSLLPITVL